MMNHARSHRQIEYLAVVVLLITFFGFFSVKIWDIDFWWHLAAGRELLATGTIPSQDPFGVYDAANNWGQTVLKSQWLGQAMLYSIYRFFGFDGIIIFRASILTACLGIVYWRCRVAQVNSLPAMVLLALAGLAILSHTGERPQLFSFLYLSLVFLLLDLYLHTSKRWLLYLVPPLFLLWANSHGGVVYGEAMLLLFCAAYLLENRLIHGSAGIRNSRLIVLVAGLSIAALLVAPNGLTTLKYIAFPENRLIRDRMSEYMSPWSLWPATMYYWAFFAVAVASLPGFFNKAHLRQGILVCAAGLISLTAYRYIPLFVMLAAPYIAASLDRMSRRLPQLPATATNLSTLVIALAFLVYGYRQDRIFQHGIMENKLPVAETALIKETHLTGRMFNTMNWGGYLIWNLSPEITVFLDGRVLDPNRIEAYTHILWMTPEGRYLFDRANFDLVLLPPGNAFTGERYPLVDHLLNSPGWRVAYQSMAGYLFVRARAS
jgi:hypothetical protein